MSELEKYQAMLERDPADTQAFVNLCNIAEKMNDYEYLAQLYIYRTQVTGDQQEIVESYFNAGEVYLDRMDDITRGVGMLVKGFEMDPTHAGIGDRLVVGYDPSNRGGQGKGSTFLHYPGGTAGAGGRKPSHGRGRFRPGTDDRGYP